MLGLTELEIEWPGGDDREGPYSCFTHGHSCHRAKSEDLGPCIGQCTSYLCRSDANMGAGHWNRPQLSSWKWFVKKPTHPQRQGWLFPQLYQPELSETALSHLLNEPNAHLITFISKFWLRGKTVVIKLSQNELLKRKANRFYSFCKEGLVTGQAEDEGNPLHWNKLLEDNKHSYKARFRSGLWISSPGAGLCNEIREARFYHEDRVV